MKSEKVTKTFRFSKELMQKLQELSDKEDRSLNNFLEYHLKAIFLKNDLWSQFKSLSNEQ